MKFLILIFSLFGIVFFGGVKKQEKKPLYFAPPNVLQHFSLGYRDFLSNILWLRFMQDSDFCSFKQGIPKYGRGPKKYCEFGWSYKMVDAITELAPQFKSPYTFSALVLSIFTGDTKGAERILQKGLKQFPEDWRINFYAAYLYAKEIKKPELAALYAYRAAQNGGPFWLYSLAAKQYGEADYSILGESILKNLLKKPFPEHQKKALKEELEGFRHQYSGKK